MKLNPSSIQISTYNKDNPYTIDGELLFFDNIVIPDTQIYVNIKFPLKDPKNILIKTDNPLGFSLNTLITKIKNVYKWIYQEEENTSSIKTFTIIDQCNCTLNYPDNIYNSLIDYKESDDSNNLSGDIKDIKDTKCSICLEQLCNHDEKKIKKIDCNHYFHESCIHEWINNNKNTCPLCRKNIFTCNNNCANGLIYKEYIGKVIPKNMRGILNRNKTDGIFKIYGYDFEDLFIDDMIYNSITKTLYPKIFG
jgi:hypothetical protein